jgi:hypothetical protein
MISSSRLVERKNPEYSRHTLLDFFLWFYTSLHAPNDLFSSVDSPLAFPFVYLTVSKHQYLR